MHTDMLKELHEYGFPQQTNWKVNSTEFRLISDNKILWLR